MLMVVFLFFISNMAAAGPRIVQPSAVDIHSGTGSDKAVLLLGDRVPQRHADLLEREARLHRAANRTHAQVLLLGGEPSK